MHPEKTLSLTAPPLAFSKVHGLGNDFILVTEENLCRHLVSQGLALAASDSARKNGGAAHTEPASGSAGSSSDSGSGCSSDSGGSCSSGCGGCGGGD